MPISTKMKSGEKALELIKFVPVDNSSKTSPQLNNDSLNHVLLRCGNRPLSIICFGGPTGAGKGLSLNYGIRYLEALEQNESDWMGWCEEDKPLSGFDFGSDRRTKGIWIWSRPFIIRAGNGKEVCILLIDIQGTHDEFSSTQEMCVSMALGLLTSSVFVYNFFHNLQEDTLINLNTYAQYALLAYPQDFEEDAPFQKIVFLIRDWNKPGQNPYGSKGGRQFLKQKLETKAGQAKESVDMREMLQKCFQSTDCFLMPSIGETALHPESTGSIAELNTNFSKNLETLTELLIAKEDPIVKEHFGRYMTASDLRTHLETIVDNFNSDDLPQATNMLQSISITYNEKNIQKSIEAYCESMQRRLHNKKYISTADLQKAHREADRLAKNTFRKFKKFGDSKTLECFTNSFEASISKEYEQFQTKNAEDRDKAIATAKKDAIQDYKDDLAEELQGDFHDKRYRQQERDIRSKIVDDFQDSLPGETMDTLDILTDSLTVQFDEILSNLVKSHQSKQADLKNEAAQEAELLLKQYKSQLNDFIRDHEYDDLDELEEAHAKIKRMMLESFQANKKVPDALSKKTLEELKVNIEKVYEERSAHIRNQQEASWEQTKSILKEECDGHLAVLNSLLANEPIPTEAQLQEAHEHNRKLILKRFQFSPYPADSSFYRKRSDLLDQKLRIILQTASRNLQELRQETEEMERRASAEFQFVRQSQSSSRSGSLAGSRTSSVQNMEHAVVPLHRPSPTGSTLSLEWEDLPPRTQSCSDQELDELLAANFNPEDLLTECVERYERAMMEKKNVASVDEIATAHDTELLAAVQLFRVRCPKKDESYQETYTSILKDRIRFAFKEYADFVKLNEKQRKMDDQDKTKRLLSLCRQSYHEEMTKHCSAPEFIRPRQLALHHRAARSTVFQIIQTSEQVTLNPEERTQLGNDMDEMYEAYRMQNDMKLNSDDEYKIDPALGIDLGTTYCCVGVFHKGKVIIIPNVDQGGNLTTPSYVAFQADGSEVIGEPAKQNAYLNPENTIYDAKRIIGRKIDDKMLLSDKKFWPFNVVDDGEIPKIQVNDVLYHPEQISAKLLKYFKEMAEKFLQLEPGTIKKVVITVPAYFNDGQRQATIDAGKLAGFETVLTILNEPTAAAMAYSMERLDKTKKNVLVFDLGGGTFDVAIVKLDKKDIEVVGVDGDTHLGGEDFDKNLMTHCVKVFKETKGIDLLEGKDSTNKTERDDARKRLRRLQTYCETAKKHLTTGRMTDVSIDAIINGIDLRVEVTRRTFEQINEKEFKSTIDIVDRALRKANVKKETIDDIVLVGGSSVIPKVQQLLKIFFEGRLKLNCSINPNLAVAYGAAVKAAMMNGEQAKGQIDFGEIHDVTPMSIGVELVGGRFDILIPKNTKIPHFITKDKYGTTRDNQTQVKISIYQGEDPVAKNNERLGEFILDGIPPAKRGEENLEVTMDINDLGILHVTAECKSTQGKNSITIQENKQRMSQETIERLLADP